MDKLAWDLTEMCRRNRDGSHTTQYQRSRALRAMSRDLRDMGYRQMRSSSLKPKHAEALVERWREQGLSDDTMRNRCATDAPT